VIEATDDPLHNTIISTDPTNLTPKYDSFHMTRQLSFFANAILAFILDAQKRKYKTNYWDNKADGSYIDAKNFAGYPYTNLDTDYTLTKVGLNLVHTAKRENFIRPRIATNDYVMQPSRKYFVRATADLSYVTNVTLQLNAEKSDQTFDTIASQATPSANTKYTLYGVFTNDTNPRRASIRALHSSGYQPIDGKLTLYNDTMNGLMVLDLGSATCPSPFYNATADDINTFINNNGKFWQYNHKIVNKSTDSLMFNGRLPSQYPAVSTYTGNGTTTTVTLNFQPKLLKIFNADGSTAITWTTGMTISGLSIIATGFTVTTAFNTNETVYYYEAF
jgi:hypothetical protein